MSPATAPAARCWSGRAAAFSGTHVHVEERMGHAVVWDGRIDNRADLRRELGSIVDAGVSDAMLAAAAYAKWGTEAPRHLLGDFSFAMWDARLQRLFCARDPVGARPFFFVRSDRFFAFASEDDALVALPGISNAVNEERVAHFLLPSYLGFDVARSWLRDVHALGGGETLVVERDGRMRRGTYWQPRAGTDRSFRSEAECLDEFRSVFGEAVRCRMDGESDVALMLSGGLDSAAILAAIEPAARDRLRTYSVVSEPPVTSIESDCIHELTRDLGSRASFLNVPSFTGVASVGDLHEIAASRPHPIDHSLLLPAIMCRAASRDGHRVMLTGVCGDLALHASHFYVGSWLARGRVAHAWRESVAASLRHTHWREVPPMRAIGRHVAQRLAPAPLRRMVRRWRAQRGTYLDGSIIRADFAHRLGVLQWLAERHDRAPVSHQHAHVAALQPPYGIASSLGGYNRVAARWGIEIRDPWSDRRVIEFCLRLPLEWKYRDGWTKYIVRRAFERELPRIVTQRIGKQHVGWHLLCRFMDDSRAAADGILERELGTVDNFVDADAARALYRRYLASGDHGDREKVFELLTLVAWLKHCQNMRPE
jgi:asparagine synthase (glutamine-hydrolysing)